jgi:hypothetical protein
VHAVGGYARRAMEHFSASDAQDGTAQKKNKK